jgi:ubiquinone/menaquinone biosynthesis C-methylase UbiE
LTFKLNGYGRSLDQYFELHPLPVSRGAKILDAGCGTGLLTLALLRNLHFPVNITSLDLSATSITAARKAIEDSPGRTRDVSFAEGNLLSLPFADNSLDLVVTSGALEYVPLEEGMTELSRVIAPGGHLLHIPCRPSPTTTFLEILFRFKKLPRKEILSQTAKHFRMVHEYRFPAMQVIGWSKTAMLAEKV